MRNSSVILTALLLLLSVPALAGCVDSPTTTRQTALIAPADLGLGSGAAPRVADDWWMAFQDPQFDRLVKSLVASNPNLQSALARIRGAQSKLSIERAKGFPEASLEGQQQRELFSNDFIYPPPYGGTWGWMGELQGSLSWNLDFWGKQAALIDQARSTAAATALDAQAARLALTGALAQTYISFWLTWQNSDITDRSVADRTEILLVTQDRLNAGMENAQAVQQAKALLALAKIDQTRSAAQRELNLHAITALAGLGAGAYASITRPDPALDAALPLPENLPADLLARRPDIMAARARIDAAAAGRAAAHAEFYPDINLAAFAGLQAIGMSNLLTGNALTLGAGPAIHLPIFDAGKIRAQYAGATATLDVAVSDYNATVMSAIRQTADALTETRSLQKQQAEQQAELDSATKSFAFAKAGYRNGLSDQVVVLNAESTVLNARKQMAALAASSAEQRIILLLSAGGPNPTLQATSANKSLNNPRHYD